MFIRTSRLHKKIFKNISLNNSSFNIHKLNVKYRKGVLISKSFSPRIKTPEKGARNLPEYYPTVKEKMLMIVIWHLFWEISAKVKKSQKVFVVCINLSN